MEIESVCSYFLDLTKNMLSLISHPGSNGDAHALVFKLVRALSALGLGWVARVCIMKSQKLI